MASAPEPMTIGGGVQMLRSQYLAGFKEECIASYPTVPILPGRHDAALESTIDDLSAQSPPELQPVLYNDVKVCTKCGKPCAFSLTACNACGTSLKEVQISKSENVFTAFLFGVRKAGKGFPYLLSLRQETAEAVVFDDLLALSTCHFNIISKQYYIPDWRFLLLAPQQGLAIIEILEQAAYAAMEPFLNNPEWKKQMFRGDVTNDEIRKKAIRSFNFPPSQYQMHIQFIIPPLIPFQHFMAETRNHFHEDRAFPVDYVKEVLALNEPYAVNMDTPIEDIVAHFDTRGVNYKDRWNKFYDDALQKTIGVQNWEASSFRYAVDNGKAHEFSVQGGQVVLGAAVADVDLKDVQVKDKAALQNYGRPYADGGKAAGSYLQKPLKPEISPEGYVLWPPAGTA